MRFSSPLLLMPVYTTTFPADETPISEGGVWVHTSSGITSPLSLGGTAFPNDTGVSDDSYVRYTRGGMGADYELIGTVLRSASLLAGDGNTHELELHVHMTESATQAFTYEVDFSHFGGDSSGYSLVRWDGYPSSFTVLSLAQDNTGFPAPIPDDYKLKVRVVGSIITISGSSDGGATYTQFAHYDFQNDATKYTTGEPAFAMYSGVGLPDMQWFGFKDITITSIDSAYAPVGYNAYHPGLSPGLGGISSARFAASNLLPVSPPPSVAVD